MSQPTDPRGSNGASGSPSSPGTPSPVRPHQDTVLLSDVPDAEALAADLTAERATERATGQATEQATKRAGPARQDATGSTATNPTHLNLSSAALAALAQRYDILGEAGHGSMGNVFKARDRETGETVALKLLKPEIASDQQMMDRFKNELLFARKITHKNVCRVYEFNRMGSVAYTSMEFVEGESLRSVLNRFGGLPARKAVDLAQQICSGLKEAHAQGIVHRDLKPENVMVDDRGNVKIMDFGIARSMESLTRMTGAMVGTPAYMAPEQVAGKPVDYRTDVYSLGLILYEMFTGAQTFHADNAVAVAMKQLGEAPVPPHEIDPGIPAPIERAILKALEKEPEKRFQSIAELEKAFSAGGAHGVATVRATTAARQTYDTVPLQPAAPTPSPSAQSVAPPSPKASPWRWVAFAFVVLFAVMFAGAAGRWAKISKQANQLRPPAKPLAPVPPDFAYDTPERPAESATNSETSPSAAKPGELPNAPKPSDTTESAPATAAAATPAPAQSAAAMTPSSTIPPVSRPAAHAAKPKPSANPTAAQAPLAVQQRADAAFKEQAPGAADSLPQPMGSVLRGKGPSYVWIARYEREEVAQNTSRKIQGLGLPSVVVPRRAENGQQAYVVFTGPFAPGRIASIIDWLKTQGFPNVREVKGFGVGQLNGAGSNGNSANSKGATP